MADTNQAMQDGAHIIPAGESPALVLAIGFCASCCAPLTADKHVRKQVDGEEMMFCNERCTQKYAPRDLFHW